MALKVLLNISRTYGSHLRGAGRLRSPKLELKNIIWRPILTHPISDYGEKEGSENVVIAGVDAAKATTRTKVTHEPSLRRFLQKKGAEEETIDSIISRYPRSVIRTAENLRARWEIWKSILLTDLQVLQILERSPESFFRSSDLENLKNNISFLSSLGLSLGIVAKLMSRAPRTFSNRMPLNRDMVEYLQYVCTFLGGDNPEEFASKIIAKNLYLLTKSTKRVKANVETMQTILKISDAEFLAWIQGSGSGILDLGNTYIRTNFDNLQRKLQSSGCSEKEITACVLTFPRILYLSPVTLNTKVDLLLQYGIKVGQILETPRVFDVSYASLQSRIKELLRYDYDFQAYGIGVLVLSSNRFKLKMGKLTDLRRTNHTET